MNKQIYLVMVGLVMTAGCSFFGAQQSQDTNTVIDTPNNGGVATSMDSDVSDLTGQIESLTVSFDEIDSVLANVSEQMPIEDAFETVSFPDIV